MEKELSTIIIDDVKRIAGAKRLRISGLSYLQTTISEDLALDGIGEAHAMLLSKACKPAPGWAPEVRQGR